MKYWTLSNNIEHPSWYPEHPATSFSSSSSPPLLFLYPFFLRSFTFCFAETAVSYFIFFVLCACLLCVWPLSFHMSTMCMSKTKFLPMWTMSMELWIFLTVLPLFFFFFFLNVLRSIYLNIKINFGVFIFSLFNISVHYYYWD